MQEKIFHFGVRTWRHGLAKSRDLAIEHWRWIIVALIGLLLIFVLTGPAHATDIMGRASVIDADTLDIHGQRIRLHGIDAPESRQTCNDAQGKPYRCGAVAANALDEWLAESRPTRCETRDIDRYKRIVAQCWRADGQDAAAWLVRNGHALDWPRYSKGAYTSEQRQAKAARAGMWQGHFELPWEWRRR